MIVKRKSLKKNEAATVTGHSRTITESVPPREALSELISDGLLSTSVYTSYTIRPLAKFQVKKSCSAIYVR